MKYSNLIPAALSAALLAACGGGGGGSDAPAATQGSVTLNGIAAKGALANANVDVYAIAAGAVDKSKALAHAVSGVDGSYALPKFVPAGGAQYVVEVSSNGSSTTQLDEVTGLPQPMPAGFSLRALLPKLDGTSDAVDTVHVTPFSEMAAAAAEKAAFAPADVAQAQSNVQQLLGFDPRLVKPANITDAAAGADPVAKKFALMLTAVSQLAKDGGLGCTAAAVGGDRAKCVVEKLAEKFNVANTNPGDAAAALATAIDTVIADPSNAGKIPDAATLVAAIKGNLGGDGTPAPADPAPAIAAVKALFNGLRADIISLIGMRSGTDHALKAQATLFRDTLVNVQEPITVAVRDADALMLAIDLYTNYKADASKPLTMGRLGGRIKSNVGQGGYQVSCTLYQDAATAVAATAQSNANFVGCRTIYYVNAVLTNGVTSSTETYRHGFTVAPNADGVNFAYTTRARKTCTGAVNSCGPTTNNVSISPAVLPDGSVPAPYAGNIAVTRTGGVITHLAFTGDLAAQFLKDGQGALANPAGKSTWALNADLTTEGDTSTYTFDGVLTAYKDQGTTIDSKLTVKPGSKYVTKLGERSEMIFDVVAGTTQSQFAGKLSATNSQLDQSGTERMPMETSLTGTLSNAPAGGSFADFFSGTVSLSIDPALWAAYDASVADSASNLLPVTLGASGMVTAPGRPTLSLTLTATGNTFDQKLTSLEAQFKTLTSTGATSRVLMVSGSELDGLSFNEASSGISFKLQRNVGLAQVTQAGKKVADIDSDAHRINFIGGEFVSLDLGI